VPVGLDRLLGKGLVSWQLPVAVHDPGKIVLHLGGSNWVAYVRHPRKGSVSLRGVAVFADGGTVDYTVIDAYQLR
jgi:hypothetical protein